MTKVGRVIAWISSVALPCLFLSNPPPLITEAPRHRGSAGRSSEDVPGAGLPNWVGRYRGNSTATADLSLYTVALVISIAAELD